MSAPCKLGDIVTVDTINYGTVTGIVVDIDFDDEGLTIEAEDGQRYDAWFSWIIYSQSEE